MVARDRNTLDLTYQQLKIAPDVMVWPVRELGETVYRIEIPKLHRFFRIGYEEYVLLSLLDGKTTIPQACGLAASKLGSRAPTADQAKTIGRWLLTNELAHFDSDPPPVRRQSVEPVMAESNPARRLIGKLNPFWIKPPLPLGDRWINRCADLFRPLLSGPAVMLGTFLMVISAFVLASNWNEFVASSANLFHPGNWIWLLVTWIVLKVVHELAHAVACNHQGGSVRETGIVFILFAPLAYVDVTSCWRMGSRWSRIAVASAGMYIELVIAAIAILLWQYVDAPQIRYLLHNLVTVAGLSTILFNANVLMRFDGYFMLADLIEIPNLYSEGSTAIRRIARRWISGEAPPPTTLGGWRKHFVTAYGVASLLWRVTICVSLAIAASAMFAGAGILITLFGVSLWIGAPMSKLYRYAVDLKSRNPNQFLRGVALSTVLAFVSVWTLVWFPVPTSIVAPAVSQYLPDTVVRSRANGFIVGIHVEDGTPVRKGELLVELENRGLVNDLRQLEIERSQNEIRLRKATGQHDASELQVLRENQRAVTERIDQLRKQVAALRVTAPRDGRVVARDLRSKLGTYLNEGDAFMVVADESDKEIVAMIRHDEVNDVRQLIGHDVDIRLAGFSRVAGRFDRIEPRASDELLDRSLAATEGGSLAVRAAVEPEDQQQVRLLQPHFRGRIQLDSTTASVIPAAVRTEVWLGYRTESIFDRLHRQINELWRSARDE
jgi:putative peptide zinc metalloprotease protein